MKRLQDAYIEGNIKSRLLEQNAQWITKEIDAFTAEFNQQADVEKENLIKNFHADELVRLSTWSFIINWFSFAMEMLEYA